jgi:hypothetical protein
MQIPEKIAFFTSAVSALAIFVYLSDILYRYPLFDWAFTDLNWTQEWLIMTVIDYYGLALAMTVVVIFSEESLVKGILWSLAFCLLGSPFALFKNSQLIRLD